MLDRCAFPVTVDQPRYMFRKVIFTQRFLCRELLIIFAKVAKSFLFWSEIKSVVDKIVANFGIDYNSRKEFDDYDKEEMDKNEWKGRYWIINNTAIVVGYDSEIFGLALKFITKKNINKK